MNINQRIKSVRNYFFPTDNVAQGNPYKGRKNNAWSPNSYITPVRFERIRVDVNYLREAISEAEQAYYPHRVKLQRVYQDTIRNGQITAAINALKELVLLKGFEIRLGEKVEENATKLLQEAWFGDLQNYLFDSDFFGYTLVGLGDIVDNKFPNLQLVKRWNISPDRHNVTSYVYSLSGVDFLNPEIKDADGNSYYDWTVYVDTPSETGASPCGYGLLYKLAYYEILLRHNTGYNATYNEKYGSPIRKGSTSKTDEGERAEFAQALKDMGADPWILLDPTDDVEIIESKSSGKQDGFENFETRQIKMINKIVLGHADALDSQTGKLGGEDAAKEAIKKKEKHHTQRMERIMNSNVLPKLKNIGLPIPLGATFHYLNNAEKVEQRKNEDANNKVTADIAQIMKNAGLKMDAKYFEERTGIPCEEIEVEVPDLGGEELKQKLKNLYGG